MTKCSQLDEKRIKTIIHLVWTICDENENESQPNKRVMNTEKTAFIWLNNLKHIILYEFKLLLLDFLV